jgi:hypothetical protein
LPLFKLLFYHSVNTDNSPPLQVSGLEQAVGRLAVDSAMTAFKGGEGPGHTGADPERRLAAVEVQTIANRDLISRQLLQFSKWPQVFIQFSIFLPCRLPDVQLGGPRLRGVPAEAAAGGDEPRPVQGPAAAGQRGRGGGRGRGRGRGAGRADHGQPSCASARTANRR